VATWDKGAKIWEARTGRFVSDFPGVVQLAFSGDGEWLVTGTGVKYQLWHVGSWQPGRVIPVEYAGTGQLALTRDGKVLAVTPAPHLVRLLETETGRELATLQAPELRNLVVLCFSADGSQLVAACGNQVIQVWDLRYLRQQLAALGLDWDLPPYPPAPADAVAESWSVRVLSQRGEDSGPKVAPVRDQD
jgi:WD40 repeat protein